MKEMGLLIKDFSYWKLVSRFTFLGLCVLLLQFLVFGWFLQRNYSLFTSEGLGLSIEIIETVKREQRLLEISLSTLFIASLCILLFGSYYLALKSLTKYENLKRFLVKIAQPGTVDIDFSRLNESLREFEPVLRQIVRKMSQK